MNSPLSRLFDKLKKGGLLSAALLDPSEIDAALDARSDVIFEREWLRLHEELSGGKLATKADVVMLDRIRERAYLATYDRSENPDLAAYVSDDFELVGRALLAGRSDAWLSGLFSEYLAGRFPTAKVKKVRTPLAELV